MSKIVAWATFALGIAHIVFGMVRYRAPLAEAVYEIVGVAAFPASPLWAPLLLSPLLVAAGYGLLR
jgi:hypothetical protein